MKLTVKNFGPIKEAKNVEISPLTVFVGPSNTGKSYMAVLVYSIVNTLSRSDSILLRASPIRSRLAYRLLPQNAKEIPAYVADRIGERWKNEFVRCLGTEARTIIEKENKFSVQISDSDGQIMLDLLSPEKSFFSKQLEEKIAAELQKIVDKKVKMEAALKNDGMDERSRDEHSRTEIRLLVARKTRMESVKIWHMVVNLFLKSHRSDDNLSDPYYLPAVRGGIMQSHRTIVSALIDRAPMAGLTDSPNIPMFNGVLSDFMQELIQASESRKRDFYSRTITHNPGIRAIGKNIEVAIMEGEIKTEMLKNRYPDFKYVLKDNGHSIPLMNASSMVSELAPVVIFIRHYLQKGDVFILEEPEAHLHPGGQRQMADVLVQLVNAGVYVMITTHSDIILEQIGNFIHAANVPKKANLKILGKEIGKRGLSQEKASIYLYNKKDEGTVVRKVPFNPGAGIVTEDHQDVTVALYNESVNLLDMVGAQND